MWNPGFSYQERVPARLDDWHRALCIYSWHHRGTRDLPGLVLGLDRGGSCDGFAFRVAASHVEETIQYLRKREQITDVYLEVMLSVSLLDGSHRRQDALTYVVDQTKEQYAGRLDMEQLEYFVRQGVGQSGRNPDYVIATVEHLRDANIPDETLYALADRLRINSTVA
jgi:cation transport protein ChaC